MNIKNIENWFLEILPTGLELLQANTIIYSGT